MNALIIPPSAETPAIDFNPQTGKFKLSGKSYPENVNEFYTPLLEFIEIYKSKPQKNTVLDFTWLYYNTATSKIIIKLLVLFKSIDTDLHIKWNCKKDNELMKEKGEEFREVLDVNIEIVDLN